MNILYFGIYSKGIEYPRNNNLIHALRLQNVNVKEAHFEMAETFGKRLAAVHRPDRAISFGFDLCISYFILAWKFIRSPSVDVIIVGHPGYFHVHLARMLNLLFRRKALLIYDSFIPLYEALVEDRKLISPNCQMGRWLHFFEKSCCGQADLILIDTLEHANYLIKNFKLPKEKVIRIFVGSTINKQHFPSNFNKSNQFNVLFVGTYIPLHGIDVILSAASILRHEKGIKFVLVGKGQLRGQMERQSRELKLENVSFKNWIPLSQLGSFIQRFDLSLGIFGTTPKTEKVIPSKIYDICTSGVPFVTCDSPAIREVFSHRENCFLIPPGNPDALAKAILEIKQDASLRKSIAQGAKHKDIEVFSLSQLGKDLLKAVHHRKKDLQKKTL